MFGWLVGAALAAGFDHEHRAFDVILDGAVVGGGVRYDVVAARRAALAAYLDGLAGLDVAGWSRDERLALAINAYNAWTLLVVVDGGPPASILDLDGGKVWKTRRRTIAGASVTLDALEHEWARELGDARVHAALVCAAKGCPPLAADAYTAAGLDAELHAAAKRWAATNAYRVSDGTLALSSIFDWYAEDFAPYAIDVGNADARADGAIGFLVRYVPAQVAATLTSGRLVAGWQPYDWALNAAEGPAGLP